MYVYISKLISDDTNFFKITFELERRIAVEKLYLNETTTNLPTVKQIRRKHEGIM